MSRLATAVVVFAAAFAFTSCDNPTPAVGISLSDAGTLRILYKPCNDSRVVRSVELQSAGAAIWRIESVSGSLLREFEAGAEAEGFATEVPLESELPGRRLRVEVSGVGDDSFAFSDLEVGRVFVVREGNMSIDQFWARDTCG